MKLNETNSNKHLKVITQELILYMLNILLNINNVQVQGQKSEYKSIIK